MSRFQSFVIPFASGMLAIAHCKANPGVGADLLCRQYTERLSQLAREVKSARSPRLQQNGSNDQYACRIQLRSQRRSRMGASGSHKVYENLYIRIAASGQERSALMARRIQDVRHKKDLPADARIKIRALTDTSVHIQIRNNQGCNQIWLKQLEGGLAELLVSRVCTAQDQKLPQSSRNLRRFFDELQ
ncbi:MAG: hypothetical protein KDK39_17235 [Leptospiraceae bacterium]|nr:hypothetical protein [Leptospiraceae bacterium]